MGKLSITAIEAAVDVHVDGPLAGTFLEAAADRWHFCARQDDGDESTSTTESVRINVYVGPERKRPDSSPAAQVSADNVKAGLVRLTQEITRAAVRHSVGRLLMFHAAGLAHPRTGETAMFVAPGNTGKTTLVRTFGSEFSYVSDETVAMTPQGEILPYPKPLSVRVPGDPVKSEVDPASLGICPPSHPCHLRGVVLLRRDDDLESDAVQLEGLDLLTAITMLAPETSSLEALPKPLHVLHSLLGSIGPVYLAHYREADSLRPLLEEMVGAPR